MKVVTETFKCDFCLKDMGVMETGIFCAAHAKGGHILCASKHFQEEH